MSAVAGSIRTRSRSHPVVLLLLAVVALLLAGCASVPSDVEVQEVESAGLAAAESEASVDEPEVLLLPPEPAPGMSPEQVLRGFLVASAAGDRDHAVAREYLTDEASEDWDDNAEVVVYDQAEPLRVSCEPDDGTATCSEPTSLRVTGQREAVIARDGSFTLDREPLLDSYGVTRVDGEWRLSSVPAGVRITRADLDRAYRAVSVYFLDPSREWVVPDRVFLPVVSRTLPRLLVDALLSGPTTRLAPAVGTAVPPGTELRSVTLEGGVVQVDLSRHVLAAPPEARRALSAQFVTTLGQLPDVTGLRLTADGEPVEVPGVGATQSINEWRSFVRGPAGEQTPGYYVAEGSVRVLPGEASDSRLGTPVGPALLSPAIAPGRPLLAGLRGGADGEELLVGRPPDALSVRLRADELTGPSWGGGRYGTWTVRRQGGEQELVLVPETGSPVVVPSPGLDDLGTVRTLTVSRDDTRVAVVAGPEGGPSRLYVGLIVPDPSLDAGVSLSRPRIVNEDLDVLDAAWAGDQGIAVLAAFGGAPAAWLVQSDGSVAEPQAAGGLPSSPEDLAAAPGLPLLLTSGGSVWRVSGGIARLPVPGGDPFYPG